MNSITLILSFLCLLTGVFIFRKLWLGALVAVSIVLIFKLFFLSESNVVYYELSNATSFVIECDTQEEIDHYWNSLGEGGIYNQCGWLEDKFGVSWQIVTTVLKQLMADSEKSQRVIQAFMQMTKFDIETLLIV